MDSGDAGQDGAFSGTWKPSQAEALNGSFVIQCKFTSKRDKNLTLFDLTDEVEKAKNLVNSGRCDCYILMTNAGLSGLIVQKIEKLFKKAGVKQIVSLGSTWICQQIRENRRLRMLVPRVYGLGDLSQILDERAYRQAKTLLASLREDLSKVVITGAYRKAAEAVDRHGFVLLVGEPAAGKTTIASLLSMAALDQWGASTLKLDDPKDVVEHWDPDEPSQFFWIDDAFGVTQYETYLVHGWNHVLPQVRTMLRKGAKIVMTSRDYIYSRARKDLKEGAFPLFPESRVVIDVRDLTLEEKQQILYNHIKLGRQPPSFRTEIKPNLQSIASHSRFVPETARRLGDPVFTKGLEIDRYDLDDFVEKQEQLLHEVLLGLDDDNKAALALIYMRNDALESPISLDESELDAIERLGSSLGHCIAALDSLNGSLVQYVPGEDAPTWRFKHPTIGDAFAGLLLDSPELLGVYVRGAPIEKLLSQITCGNISLEHAIALPKAFFRLVIDRLDNFSSRRKYKSRLFASWSARDRLHNFLGSRCSKEFLIQYIDGHPDILERVSEPGIFLSAVSEVRLAIRLHKLGLLPEEHRKRFVATVISYALDGEDLYAVESIRIQSVFTPAELSDFRRRIRTELLPKLDEVRHAWQSNRDSDRAPDEHIQPLLDSFSALKEEFASESKIVSAINREIALAEAWISEKLADESDEDASDRTFGDIEGGEDLSGQHRDIFDDVDQ